MNLGINEIFKIMGGLYLLLEECFTSKWMVSSSAVYESTPIIGAVWETEKHQ